MGLLSLVFGPLCNVLIYYEINGLGCKSIIASLTLTRAESESGTWIGKRNFFLPLERAELEVQTDYGDLSSAATSKLALK